MAITFNEWVNLGYIYTYDGGVYSANNTANSVFDYFPDDAAVNDALYFGYRYKYNKIQVYLGTAFAATSVTFVWEYYNTSNTWTTLAVTDGTSNFTTTGEQTITFTAPSDWKNVAINGQNYTRWVIRCRVSAIDTPTEGGANSTQVCQCGDNRITVTDYTEGTPCTMTDIYDADVAGSWGVVDYVAGSYWETFTITANFTLNTYFAETRKSIIIENYNFLIGSLGQLQLGTKNAGTLSTNGCLFVYDWAGMDFGTSYVHNGNIKIYDSKLYFVTAIRVPLFIPTASAFGVAIEVVDSIIESNMAIAFQGMLDFRRNTIVIPSGTYVQYRYVTTMSDIVHSCDVRSGTWTGGDTFYNISTPESILGAGSNATDTFRNLKQTPSDITLTRNPSVKDIIRVEFSYDLKVVDLAGDGISDVTVTIDDVDGVEAFNGTTDANGDITQQWLRQKNEERWHDLAQTTVTKTPHTVTISKTGYKTRTIIYTMDRKREEIEVLKAKSIKKDINGETYAEINSKGDLLKI